MAESIYMENHSINEAIEMYQSIYKWDEAIDVAEAAAVKERERDILGAINLYLRGNMPSKAAKLLMNNRELIHNQEMVSKIATTLIKSDLFENVKIFLFVAL